MTEPISETAVEGWAVPELDALVRRFGENLTSGAEVGGALHVRVGGDVVADLWGGLSAPGIGTASWDFDTLAPVWSVSKILTTVAVLHACAGGAFDLDDPLARHWPEFGAAGKDRVTIADVLSHSSGVAGWDEPITAEEAVDGRTGAERIAAQAPWWEPGSASGYAAVSFAAPLGELLRRTTGIGLRAYVDEHVVPTLGADFRLGARSVDVGRVATLVPPEAPPELPDGEPPLYRRVFRNPRFDAGLASTAAWREGDLGAANGHATAEGAALVADALIRGTFLPQELGERALTPRIAGDDLVLGMHLAWGLGVAISDARSFAYLPDGVAVWGGWGGSLVAIDPTRDLVAAYVMNRMTPQLVGSARAETYMRAIFAAL